MESSDEDASLIYPEEEGKIKVVIKTTRKDIINDKLNQKHFIKVIIHFKNGKFLIKK